MTFVKSILLVVLHLLIGAGIQAEVLPLRSNNEARQSGISINTISPARQQWVRQSPPPTGRNLTGVSWATATHGLASGDALTLVETFDGGLTWRDVNLGSPDAGNSFYNVLCKDPQKIPAPHGGWASLSAVQPSRRLDLCQRRGTTPESPRLR